MKPHEGHRKSAPSEVTVEIVTVSTSRYNQMESGEEYTDEAGDAAKNESEKIGFIVSSRRVVSDNAPALRACVRRFLSGNADALLFTGGTGISHRDITIETVGDFFEKELDGFGELLRRASFSRVGAASALTRATAGVAKGKLILCMPGSPDAVRTAMKVFGREIPHALFVARSRYAQYLGMLLSTWSAQAVVPPLRFQTLLNPFEKRNLTAVALLFPIWQ